MDLKEYKTKLGKLSLNEQKLRDLYLRDLSLGKIQGSLTGYASIDKPWLKYYSEDTLQNIKIPEESAYLHILKSNKNNMNNTALIYGDKEITYSELFKKIDLVANSFHNMGIKKGDIVSVCLANTPETAYIFYALNKIGAICDFMDPRATSLVMKEHLNLAKSKKLLTISDCYPIFKNLKNETMIDTIISINPLETLYNNNPPINNKIETNDLYWNQFLELGKNSDYNYVDNEINTPITVLHTGGSTGEPKGALLTNYNLNSLATQWLNTGIAYEKGDKILSLMPPFVSFGLAANLHVPLSNSMKIILIPTYEPEKTLDLIQLYKPNCVPASPAHWEQVYLDPRSKKMDWSFLKIALMGGEILNPEVEKGLNKMFKENNSQCKFVGAYGMTETSTALAIGFDKKVNLDGSVGAPLPLTNLSIINPDTEEELEYNQIGEICASTPNTMLGYYGRDEETNKILKTHNDGKIWVHTGDLGYMTENGILFIKGRIKRIIIRFDGIKIYPIDIETKLYQNPIIAKSAVIGTKDQKHLHGENPVAYIVLKDNNLKEDYEYIKDYCEKNIIDYAVPVDYIFTNELPYTRNGKIDFNKLKQDYKARILKK